jgi:hypothetical protein
VTALIPSPRAPVDPLAVQGARAAARTVHDRIQLAAVDAGLSAIERLAGHPTVEEADRG